MHEASMGVQPKKWKYAKLIHLSISVRSTLGKIETTPQIGDTLEKVCKNTILNHKCKRQEWYMTKIM